MNLKSETGSWHIIFNKIITFDDKRDAICHIQLPSQWRLIFYLLHSG